MCSKKKVFSYNPDFGKTAYMNWRTNKTEIYKNLLVLAEGYSETALCLSNLILADNSDKKADLLIHSILYSLNQSIELYEKCTTLIVNKLMKKESSIPNCHDIKQLYNQMIARITEKEKSTKGLNKNFAILYDYIEELYRYIKVKTGKLDIDFARYPIRTDGTPHFYITAVDNAVVDVEYLVTVIEEIRKAFFGTIAMYIEELEQKENI